MFTAAPYYLLLFANHRRAIWRPTKSCDLFIPLLLVNIAVAKDASEHQNHQDLPHYSKSGEIGDCARMLKRLRNGSKCAFQSQFVLFWCSITRNSVLSLLMHYGSLDKLSGSALITQMNDACCFAPALCALVRSCDGATMEAMHRMSVGLLEMQKKNTKPLKAKASSENNIIKTHQQLNEESVRFSW